MYNGGWQEFAECWLPLLEAEIRSVLQGEEPATASHFGMMHYHMGWVDEAFRPVELSAGKRIRPLLCLMACEAVGGDPRQALPAAASVEILHNFSLIHDDVEDGDETRRHRPTVWKLWGVPQAINAGDGMFALAFGALQRLSDGGVSPETVLAALDGFTRTSVVLTEGQHLDMDFESRRRVSVDEYMRMIEAKTAFLIATSLFLGALIGGGSPEQQEALGRFGQAIGLSFQIRDDILGIWGDPVVTGKAIGNDILRRKKSLPMIYALNHETVGPELQRWLEGEVRPADLPALLALLEQAGAQEFAEEQLRMEHQAGLEALQAALGKKALTSPLLALADMLLDRQA